MTNELPQRKRSEASFNTNQVLLIEGQLTSLSTRHRQLRREGYRR